MLIRKFTAGDFEDYCRLSTKFYASGASEVFELMVTEDNYNRTFEACLSDSPFLEGFFVYVNDALAGYFLLTYTWYNELNGEAVTLDEIFIDDEFRGRGIATDVINWIANTHQEYHGILLEVKVDNKKAVSLYERIGFEFMGYSQMVLKPKEIYHRN